MKMSLTVDISQFLRAVQSTKIGPDDLKSIEDPGARVLINGMRTRVPVDTSATKNSISSHYEKETANELIDQIGPETEYGPYLEYGTGEYAESGQGRKGGWVYKGRRGFVFTLGSRPQPFVRPTISADGDTATNAIQQAMRAYLEAQWPG